METELDVVAFMKKIRIFETVSTEFNQFMELKKHTDFGLEVLEESDDEAENNYKLPDEENAKEKDGKSTKSRRRLLMKSKTLEQMDEVT